MRTSCASILLALSLAACDSGSSALDGGSEVDATTTPTLDAATSPDLTSVGPYPIILVHGLSGFAKIGPIEYFAGVPAVLQAAGRTVYTPALAMFNSSEARGQALVDVIHTALVQTGAKKVVLIGHSQGGMDARWAAAHAADSVAAVVTIGTPHRGSKVADVALGLTPGVAQNAASSLLGLLGGALDPSGMPNTDLSASLDTLSTAGAATFNANVPDAAGIRYYSIAGRSSSTAASSCPPSNVPFIHTWDSQTDTLDAALWSTYGILVAAEFPGTPVQDGLVTVPSAQWGTFLGCIPADHMNEICQPANAAAGIGNGFDCHAFYRGLESWLRDGGL